MVPTQVKLKITQSALAQLSRHWSVFGAQCKSANFPESSGNKHVSTVSRLVVVKQL